MNRFIRRIGDVSARRPWTTVGAWTVLVAFVVALSGVLGGAFVDDFTAPGSESATALELLEERFPEAAGGSAVAVFAAPDGQRLDAFRPAVAAALSQVAGSEHVAAVSDPFAPDRITSDRRIAFAEITFEVPSTELGVEPTAALADALEPASAAGLSAELGGEAAFLNSEPPTSGTEVVGVLAALLVLVVAFGTVVAALVPIALALVAVGAGYSGVVLLAGAMDVSTAAPTIGVMVGLGVGIDYSLFIVSRYREHRAAGTANAEAPSLALGASGTAVLFAGMTVVVSMAALVLTGVGVLTSIGLATSIIVLVAVATALTLLPALLSLLGDRIDAGRLIGRRRSSEPTQTTAWWRLAHQISARPWPYLLVTAGAAPDPGRPGPVAEDRVPGCR